MGEEGLEPSCLTAIDLKSIVYTIPPLARTLTLASSLVISTDISSSVRGL